jgi:hypothetical protein
MITHLSDRHSQFQNLLKMLISKDLASISCDTHPVIFHTCLIDPVYSRMIYPPRKATKADASMAGSEAVP